MARINLPVKQGEESGGKWGGILGAIAGAVGAIAALPTGGASLAVAAPAVIGGLGAGSTVGSIAGGVIAPGSQDKQIGVPVDDSPIHRRLAAQTEQQSNEMQQMFSESTRKLADAYAALEEAPQYKDKYQQTLYQGLKQSLKSDMQRYKS